MFFVGNILNNKVGVVDTKDSVIEYYNVIDLAGFGVDIRGFNRENLGVSVQCPTNILSEYDYSVLKSKQAFKLYRETLKGEFLDFMSNHYVLGISDYLFQNGYSLNNLLKCYNYSETDGFIVLVLSVRLISVDSFMLVRITEDGNLISTILGKTPLDNYNWFMSQSPIGSGMMFSLIFGKDILNSLRYDRVYLKVNYTEDRFVIFNVANLERAYLR